MVLSCATLWAVGVCILLLRPYFIRGEMQHSFKDGEQIPLLVNRLSSGRTQIPVGYYSLPFCQEPSGSIREQQNIGQEISGYSIMTSPYKVLMKKDMYCEILCMSNLGRTQRKGVFPNKTVKAIQNRYHHNWILDGIPSASRFEDDSMITTRYWHGFPVGFVNTLNYKAYIHNHVNIEVSYHDTGESFQVTGFTVQPFSIQHDYEKYWTPIQEEYWFLPRLAKIQNPISSCTGNHHQHTNYEMVTAKNRFPQEASGEVLFTYDVIWRENKVLRWSERWDIYTTMDNAIPDQIHWFSIINSSAYLTVLVAMVIIILRRYVRNKMNQDTGGGREVEVPDEEVLESLHDKGYTVVHISHFDPPEGRSLWILSLFCGAGAQLLATKMLTIVTAALGFLHSSASGRLVMFQLLVFVISGVCNGFVSMQTIKLCGGDFDWKKVAVAASLLFPGVTFTLFLVQQLVAVGYHSTLVVPFYVHAVLLGCWLCVLSPLVFAGAYWGDLAEPIKLPQTPRSILLGLVNYRTFRQGDWKVKCCFVLFCVVLHFSLIALALLWIIRRCLVTNNSWRPSFNGVFWVLLGGVISFGVVFVEFYYILSAFWMEYYYATFGFLAVVAVIFFLSCGTVSVLFNFTQLIVEDTHSWWWQFHCGGAAGFWLILYSLLYANQLELATFSSGLLYIGYMVWLALTMYLMSGFVGMVSSVWFVKKIFSIAKAGESIATSTNDVELTEVDERDSSPPDVNAGPASISGTMT